MKKILFFIATLGLCFSSLGYGGYGYCDKTGERKKGMNKICYYNCSGTEKVLIIDAYEFCPYSIYD